MTFQNVDSLQFRLARAVHRGLPSFFRARCYTASRGGADGYFNVGRKLAASLARLTPDDIDEDDEWCSELEALAESAPMMTRRYGPGSGLTIHDA